MHNDRERSLLIMMFVIPKGNSDCLNIKGIISKLLLGGIVRALVDCFPLTVISPTLKKAKNAIAHIARKGMLRNVKAWF